MAGARPLKVSTLMIDPTARQTIQPQTIQPQTIQPFGPKPSGLPTSRNGLADVARSLKLPSLLADPILLRERSKQRQWGV